MKDRKKFLVDSKQACFLCLKVGGANEDCKISPWSISQLCRYLKLDFQKVFNVSLSLLQTTGGKIWEETDMLVTLCKDCHSVSTKFSRLFQELELIKLKLNASVKTIHELMTNADKDRRRVEEYRKLLTLSNPLELINVSIMENLRKETMQKCLMKVRNTLPKVRLEQIKDEPRRKDSLAAPPVPQLNMEMSSFRLQSELGQDQKAEDEMHADFTNEMEFPVDNDDEDDNQLNEDIQGDPLGNVEATMEPEIINESRAVPKNFAKGNVSKTKCHTCKICGVTLTSKPGLLQHLRRSHTGTNKYNCIECPESFNDNRKLKSHLMTTHLCSLFKDCNVDGDTFEDFEHVVKVKLQECVLLLGDTQEYSCKYCKIKYKTKRAAKFHVLDVHRHNVVSEIVGGSSTPVMIASAPLLPTTWRNDDTSLNLSSTVHRTRMFSCPYCNKQFRQYHAQRGHMLRSHRFEVFQKYFGSDATSFKVHSILEGLLRKEFNNVGGNEWECRQCYIKYSSLQTGENHILVTHFNDVVLKLKNHLQSEERMKGGGHPFISFQEQSQVEETVSSEDLVIKPEIEDEGEDMIVPD